MFDEFLANAKKANDAADPDSWVVRADDTAIECMSCPTDGGPPRVGNPCTLLLRNVRLEPEPSDE